MRELDERTVADARIYVDTEGAIQECGELCSAAANLSITREKNELKLAGSLLAKEVKPDVKGWLIIVNFS